MKPEFQAHFLITGGLGFIGSHLAQFLLDQGGSVTVLDDESTGRVLNIQRFQNHKRFRWIRGDIRILQDCHKACEGIDYVLHQAAVGSVPRSIAQPDVSTAVNVQGFVHMLMASKEAKVKKFVYASSSAVYGNSDQPVKREGEEGQPLSPYAITKQVGEHYAQNFYQLFGLRTIGLRYFNVFGPYQDTQSSYAAVIPRFVTSLQNQKPGIIYGDGLQSRDFTYIDNVIDANVKACFASSRADGQAFNVACGKTYTLRTIYSKILDHLNMNLDPEYTASRAGDVRHSHADIAKAYDFLGYEPLVDLETGLAQTVSWYQQNFQKS